MPMRRTHGPMPDDVETTDPGFLKDCRVWVEGVAIIRANDHESRLARDLAREQLAKIGLKLHDNYFDEGDPHTKIRRRWSSRQIQRDEVLAVISDYPGRRIRELAPILFNTNNSTWTHADAKQAEMKAYNWMTKLLQTGSIKRRYDKEGKAIFFLPDHPDVDRYAITASGRLVPERERDIAEASIALRNLDPARVRELINTARIEAPVTVPPTIQPHRPTPALKWETIEDKVNTDPSTLDWETPASTRIAVADAKMSRKALRKLALSAGKKQA